MSRFERPPQPSPDSEDDNQATQPAKDQFPWQQPHEEWNEFLDQVGESGQETSRIVGRQGEQAAHSRAQLAKQEVNQWLSQNRELPSAEEIATRIGVEPRAVSETMSLFRTTNALPEQIREWIEAKYIAHRIGQLAEERRAATRKMYERPPTAPIETERSPAEVVGERLRLAQSRLEQAGYYEDALEVGRAIARMDKAQKIGDSQFVLWAKTWPRSAGESPELTLFDKVILKIGKFFRMENADWDQPKRPRGGLVIRQNGEIQTFYSQEQFVDNPKPPHPAYEESTIKEADSRNLKRPGPHDEVVSWRPEGKAREIIIKALQPEHRELKSQGKLRVPTYLMRKPAFHIAGLPDAKVYIEGSRSPDDWTDTGGRFGIQLYEDAYVDLANSQKPDSEPG